jgi:hypothetical protein
MSGDNVAGPTESEVDSSFEEVDHGELYRPRKYVRAPHVRKYVRAPHVKPIHVCICML